MLSALSALLFTVVHSHQLPDFEHQAIRRTFADRAKERAAGAEHAPNGKCGAAGGSVDESLTFESFIQKYQRTYVLGTNEYAMRRELYQKRAAEIEEQNCRHSSWKATINRLADWTDDELSALRGWRGARRPTVGGKDGRPAPNVQLVRSAPHDPLPSNVSWAHLKSLKEIEDQKTCGSCWAFAAGQVLKANYEIAHKETRTFSYQQIVDCAPNPLACGGTGGCDGATIEIAFLYALENGLETLGTYPYNSKNNKCSVAHAAYTGGKVANAPDGKSSGLIQQAAHYNMYDVSLGETKYGLRAQGGASFGLIGYQRLPENQLEPVMRALAEAGPVGVSIATNPGWNRYNRGIMDKCRKDAIIDHAVVLLGYGQATAASEHRLKYWLIQNSWGADWGEAGRIRLIRHDDQEEAAFCGIDDKPEIGSGCNGGPSEVKVCGSCGILYDAVLPQFASKSAPSRGSTNSMTLAQTDAHIHVHHSE
eukprot:gnl/TRDRNA2_/TRDRNA2_182517_c0_seq1.p1 gnl/TRDRNA2_/TRDRNA2_182517_c0~~gnl/TRDRNA2_/TRDRNA2_182517_c0_seq1.p1  ORF type:complete len:479 (+),score=66.97 gnl/TRDRNA2_/TRDRNA2_182517_c0_seq1:57-1493(+)